MKKNILAACWLLLAVAAAPLRAEEPFPTAYYYKVRWGFQQEFERLYFKNHYPVMLALKERGRIKGINVYRPTFHGEGRADWTFLVVIVWPGWNTFSLPSEEEEIAKALFPDQETFRREEQRRFELLEAHWDVPLVPVKPPG
jgi:hypothetical protein